MDRKTVTAERNVQFSNRQVQLIEGDPTDIDLGLEKSITESEPIIPVPEEISEPIAPEIVTGKRIRRPTKKIQDIIEGVGEGNAEIKHLTASLGQETSEIISDP